MEKWQHSLQQNPVVSFIKKKKEISEYPEEFLNELCFQMNRAVCDYGQENKINSMGTTAAILAFGADQVYSCNLGDSRIYRVSPEGQIHQLSLDHVLGEEDSASRR